MTGQLFTADHHVYDLPALLEWNITHTGSVPCDCFSVSFLFQKDMLPVLEMASGFVALDGPDLVLHAIVDEYSVELGNSGLIASVTGRGFAARLLDNESRPVTYQEATAYPVSPPRSSGPGTFSLLPPVPANGRPWRISVGLTAVSPPAFIRTAP